jgi:hypothetical protein
VFLPFLLFHHQEERPFVSAAGVLAHHAKHTNQLLIK